MIASALVSKRRRDCLHQTPIEAQPSRSDGADPQAHGPSNDFRRYVRAGKKAIPPLQP
jgi:hypothetical protein